MICSTHLIESEECPKCSSIACIGPADIYCSNNHALIVWLKESSNGTEVLCMNAIFSNKALFFRSFSLVHSIELIPFQLENKNEFHCKFLQPNLQSYHSSVNPSSQQNEKKNASKRRANGKKRKTE